ncbi:MAG: hypothetical protein H6574_18750 [Lewinellaceae bacterium]|nr:hypothetical protein [Lewinellaceae bacterium]
MLWILNAEKHIPSKLVCDVTVYEYDPETNSFINEYKLTLPAIDSDLESLDSYVALGYE